MNNAHIAPARIVIGGHELGYLRARDVYALSARFPDFIKDLMELGKTPSSMDVCTATLATAAGKPGDAATEAALEQLPAGLYQRAIVWVIEESWRPLPGLEAEPTGEIPQLEKQSENNGTGAEPLTAA